MQERMVDNFTKADGELGARVAQGLNLQLVIAVGRSAVQTRT
jgi:catalase